VTREDMLCAIDIVRRTGVPFSFAIGSPLA
jgi:hypothetical protein